MQISLFIRTRNIVFSFLCFEHCIEYCPLSLVPTVFYTLSLYAGLRSRPDDCALRRHIPSTVNKEAIEYKLTDHGVLLIQVLLLYLHSISVVALHEDRLLNTPP